MGLVLLILTGPPEALEYGYYEPRKNAVFENFIRTSFL
jgi:hypothetical protein